MWIQYEVKLEGVQDWAAHLDQLRSISLEFDADVTPTKAVLIRYFRESLKPSIKARMDQRGRELDSWDNLAEKACNAKAQASF